MYPILHHSLVRKGLIRGFRCPVSRKMFVAVDPTKAQLDALFKSQQDFAAELYFRQDGGCPNPLRTLESRQRQFIAELPVCE